MTDAIDKTIYLKDYQVPTFFIDKTDLQVELDYLDESTLPNEHENSTKVIATLSIRRNPKSDNKTSSLSLNGHHFELISIAIDGSKLTEKQYEQTDEHLTLKEVPDRFVLTIETTSQPQKNTALEGLYKSSGNFCTQCEAQGFRRITYYLDQPDIMSVFSTTIIADKKKYPVLLSNGNPVETQDLDNGKHLVKWVDPFKKPAYLFALVAGDLSKISDSFTTKSGRKIALEIFVEHKNNDKCDHAMASLKKSMLWDEETFGLEYDLDIYMIVAVEDFNMGAMENKGLNVFNAKYVLARSDTATDKDYEGIEAVIAHEYFHNWTGNRVTCRDWFQLSLKEGLTVFRDQEFTSDMQSRAVKRIEDVKILRTYQFAEDASPMAHPIRPAQYMEINNFYTVTVYNKGAEIIRMIHTIIGKDNFRKGIDLYFQRHDGQAVTTEDFVASMSDASGIDLEDFKNWYNQAGTPSVKISNHYDENEQIFHLTATQSCPDTPEQLLKKPFHIPLSIGLLDKDGNEMLSTTLQLKDKSCVYAFSGIKSKPILSTLRNFSSPITVESDVNDEALAFLMGNDQDNFNRWDAGQTLFTKIILEQVTQLQNNQEFNVNEPLFQTFLKAFKQLVLDETIDDALKALAMTLPDMGYLLDQMEIADVDNVYLARRHTQYLLTEQLFDELEQLYKRCKVKGNYQFNSIDAGKRSLKKICMSYLLTQEKQMTFNQCFDDFDQADNMTDSIGALSLLSLYDHPLSQKSLDIFEQKWKGEPLVMDKWFILQAVSSKDNSLNKIKELMGHDAFDIKNPNRVRSLIGAFAAQNYLHFHAKDGSGYRFIAEQAIALDQLNPQITARLVKNFCRWRHFDQARQQLMKNEIEAILSQKKISPDVYEILSKSI